jgi:hypothetical protein
MEKHILLSVRYAYIPYLMQLVPVSTVWYEKYKYEDDDLVR